MIPKKGQRAYISGAISSIPNFDDVKKMFREAERQLEQLGYVPVSPLNSGLPKEATWGEHMKADTAMLCTCDFVVFLPTWRNSRGAKSEMRNAIDFGMPLMKFSQPKRQIEKTPEGCYKYTEPEIRLETLNIKL